MKAIVTTGNGGYEKLEYRDMPVPVLSEGEVLVRVLAAGMNNTEINTRLGWYSSSVQSGTGQTSTDTGKSAPVDDGGWNEKTPFPFIQGTDCCGIVKEAYDPENANLVGKRILVRACMRSRGFDSPDNIWMGSDFDGAFAEYAKVPATEVFPVDCSWSDAELGTIPCAYGTSENMLHRAGLKKGETVLITGASGGVGSATVQLARRRGTRVIAVTSPSKKERLLEIGADEVFTREDDLLTLVGPESVDLVVDNVAGDKFPVMLKLLRRGGRLVSSGAIAGPVVPLDMRDLYLKDIRLIGCTAWDEPVFPNLVSYIERGEIQPLLVQSFPLMEIAEAQKLFLTKQHVGKFVLIPPR